MIRSHYDNKVVSSTFLIKWAFLCSFHLLNVPMIKSSLTFTVTFTIEGRWLPDRPPADKRGGGGAKLVGRERR